MSGACCFCTRSLTWPACCYKRLSLSLLLQYEPSVQCLCSQVTKNLDVELPRKVLKKILGPSAVLELIKEQLQSGPKELGKPMQMLQELASNLDGDIDELIARFGKVFSAFQSSSVTVSGARMGSDGGTGFSFPLDIIKKISPVEVLSLVGDKLPGPMKSGFDKVSDDACPLQCVCLSTRRV